MNLFQKIDTICYMKYVPGILGALIIALCGILLSSLIPGNLISAGVFSLLVGMMIHPAVAHLPWMQPGISFTGKRLLRVAIIGMGVSLSIQQVVQVGALSLVVMAFTLAMAFGGGYLMGKTMGIPWRQSALICAGTGICGGSAIAAIAPVIRADSQDIAYALSATFLFDILMVVLFPLMGRALQMSDLGFGLWTGTAVNDTSSVVAAGYAFSEVAGNYAIVVKLTRTLSIVPAVIVFSLIQLRSERKELVDTEGRPYALRTVFPWFVLAFLAVVMLKSTHIIPDGISTIVARIGRFCMVMALGAIGLKTDARQLVRSGLKPMLLGLLVSSAVVGVSYLVQSLLAQL